MKLKEERDIITFEEFTKADIRVGRIKEAYHQYSDASVTYYELSVDFGYMGTKNSIIQLTDSYTADELEGRLVIALTNLSTENNEGEDVPETFILKIVSVRGKDVLIRPDWEVPLGCRVL